MSAPGPGYVTAVAIGRAAPGMVSVAAFPEGAPSVFVYITADEARALAKTLADEARWADRAADAAKRSAA